MKRTNEDGRIAGQNLVSKAYLVSMVVLMLVGLLAIEARGQAGIFADVNGGSSTSVKTGAVVDVDVYFQYNGIDSIHTFYQYLEYDSTLVEFVEGSFSWGDSLPAGAYKQWSAADPAATVPRDEGEITTYWLSGSQGAGPYLEEGWPGSDDLLIISFQLKALNCGTAVVGFKDTAPLHNMYAAFDNPNCGSSASVIYTASDSAQNCAGYHEHQPMQAVDATITITGNCLTKSAATDVDWSAVKALYR